MGVVFSILLTTCFSDWGMHCFNIVTFFSIILSTVWLLPPTGDMPRRSIFISLQVLSYGRGEVFIQDEYEHLLHFQYGVYSWRDTCNMK